MMTGQKVMRPTLAGLLVKQLENEGTKEGQSQDLVVMGKLLNGSH